MIRFALDTRLRSTLLPKPAPPILEWAENTIVIPDGPLKGQAFDADVQPFSRLFLRELDNPRWSRVAAVGPTQSGKSLICYVVPTLYHLFALNETCICGLPDLNMAGDKWVQDFLPVLEASAALRKLLPARGPGSRSGRVRASVRFRNGSTLRFMSGGGRSTSRAGFTSRVLAVTEVDGFANPDATNIEADAIKQLEARQRAYLATGTKTFFECTVTTSTGRIWREYVGGTESQIARPCPHCSAYVVPERENLTGWEDAEDELQARAAASWCCPSCGEAWSEAERYAANRQSVLVHRGQEVSADGQVTGPIPATHTLGFRWGSIDNHFSTAADVAADEWNAAREPNRDNAEKELRQFVYAIPFDPPEVQVTPLNSDEIVERTAALKKGIVPNDCTSVVVGIDTGKRMLHWTAIACTSVGVSHVIEYGEQSVAADKLGVRQGLVEALRALQSYFAGGWHGETGTRGPSQVWIDSGWHEHAEAIYEFCSTANKGLPVGGERFRATKGYGEGQRRLDRYWIPKKLTADVRFIGDGYHLTRSERAQSLVVHINSDYWKSEVHQRLSLPADSPLALLLYEAADPAQHREFAEQLTAERQLDKWIEGRGEVIVWERIRRANHFLDSTYAALAASSLVAFTTAQAAQAQPKRPAVIFPGYARGGESRW